MRFSGQFHLLRHVALLLLRILCFISAGMLLETSKLSAAPAINENFASDPVVSGRFFQETTGTDTVFSFNAAQQNLLATLDVDSASAYYLSSAFPTITDFEDIS